MMKTELIPANDICNWHNVEYEFISSLGNAGLLKLKVVKQAAYIRETELQKLEKMIRMHNELEINVAGIEAILHLLDRVEQMQEEMRVLRNRLG